MDSTLVQFNRKDVFYRVARHLLTQNKQSRCNLFALGSGESTCAYRGDDGTKCAVGCLIPDELYEKRFEGLPVWTPSIFRRLIDDEFHNYIEKCTGAKDVGDFSLLENLQKIHDKYEPDGWKSALVELRNTYGWTDEI